MRAQLFHLDPQPGTTLQSQLREMLVGAILDGHIPGGSPLPSGRQLAEQLGVSRNTVVLAYQHLVDEGYLVSKERSGYYVNDEMLADRVRYVPREQPPGKRSPPDWDRRFAIRPSEQRNITKPRNWDKYPYPFIYGQFDPSLFPIAEWRDCCRHALSVVAVRHWLRDSVDGDDKQLIEQLHTRVLPRRGVWARPDEILVTVGAQQALYLISSLLVTPDSAVAMEDPGYADARNIFTFATRKLQPIPVDDDGITISDALKTSDVIYVTPSHQFPTTVTMPLERRRALLDCAADHDAIIIEDDYESEVNFLSTPTPALKSLDANDRVIYVGSFSKTMAPGLRLGFMVGPAPFIREARALRRLMLRHPPTNNQRTIGVFIARGHYDALLKRVRQSYKDRWMAMHEAIQTYLPHCHSRPSAGGSSYWLEGPPGLDANQLAELAAEEGILIEPGDVYFMQKPIPFNYFRLGISSIPLDRIDTGIRQLSEVMGRL